MTIAALFAVVQPVGHVMLALAEHRREGGDCAGSRGGNGLEHENREKGAKQRKEGRQTTGWSNPRVGRVCGGAEHGTY
jgi:hypothetical protein